MSPSGFPTVSVGRLFPAPPGPYLIEEARAVCKCVSVCVCVRRRACWHNVYVCVCVRACVIERELGHKSLVSLILGGRGFVSVLVPALSQETETWKGRVLCQFTWCLSLVIGGSCHKYHFCRDKRRVLSRQKYACRDKSFVETKHVFYRDKRMLAATKYLSRQTHGEMSHTSLLGACRRGKNQTREDLKWRIDRGKGRYAMCIWYLLCRRERERLWLTDQRRRGGVIII